MSESLAFEKPILIISDVSGSNSLGKSIILSPSIISSFLIMSNSISFGSSRISI